MGDDAELERGLWVVSLAALSRRAAPPGRMSPRSASLTSRLDAGTDPL